jgi:hypothetical protein
MRSLRSFQVPALVDHPNGIPFQVLALHFQMNRRSQETN